MLNLYRRHLKKSDTPGSTRKGCPHQDKGAAYTKCSCPIWCDGELNGKRYRRSMGTRDWGRAALRLAKLEAPGARQPKPITEAIEAFNLGQADKALATRTKYRRVLRFFEALVMSRSLRSADEIGIEDIDAYRASRKISSVTWQKEIEILRQFFQFCVVRKWADENPAAGVEKPKNLKANEVVPYTREEVVRILAACDGIGRGAPRPATSSGAETVLRIRWCAQRSAR